MLEAKTVFVVGAGASAEFGLPVGSTLREKIVDRVRRIRRDDGGTYGDIDLIRHLGVKFAETDVADAALAIEHGIFGKPSVDEFLEWHSDNEVLAGVGKAAIAKCMIEAEATARKTFFGEGSNFRLRDFADRWLGRFFVMLMSGAVKSATSDPFANTNFVIFNYDRCVEYFLALALQTQGFDAAEAQRLSTNPNVFIHPYGSLGELFVAAGLSFGGGDGRISPCAVAERIRTYSEQQDSGGASRVRQVMAEAQTLVFLGFSFNRQNVDLLRPRQETSATRIFATAFERSDYDIETIRWDLVDLLKPRLISSIKNGNHFHS